MWHSMRRMSRRILAVSLILVLVVVSFAQRRTQPSVQKRPRLVLLIVVDQFRYDYLERFGDLFGPNGFRRLIRDGASWTQSNYDHMPTYTAPGHGTMMTGAYPAESGIIGNEWLDRATGKRITSVSDESVKLLGGIPTDPASSPSRLMASTVGDELRLATNDRAKVIGISVKDRSAILPAGRHANAAYWFSITFRDDGLVDLLLQPVAGVGHKLQQHEARRQILRNAKWERVLPEERIPQACWY